MARQVKLEVEVLARTAELLIRWGIDTQDHLVDVRDLRALDSDSHVHSWHLMLIILTHDTSDTREVAMKTYTQRRRINQNFKVKKTFLVSP
jgi:hypothetical protein